ncbi:8321_t:CDS:2 [Racocetra persica]|uniref:8321_t:CDS:1 n=1 Tax=Racocetra persica TaxID=160502 RepID=A0ACA9MM29_9GLOM|nr:8321_t:CDS:2 [Racocetra persica]
MSNKYTQLELDLISTETNLQPLIPSISSSSSVSKKQKVHSKLFSEHLFLEEDLSPEHSNTKTHPSRTKAAGLKDVNLILDVKTWWNSTHNMLA